jgi:hypothetical protein
LDFVAESSIELAVITILSSHPAICRHSARSLGVRFMLRSFDQK